MKRLIDPIEATIGMERLTELVSAAEPFRPNPFSKKRVLLRLRQGRGTHRTLLKVGGAAAGWLFIVGSAVAGAAWWRARVDVARQGSTLAPSSIASPLARSTPPSPVPLSAIEPPPPSSSAGQASAPSREVTTWDGAATNSGPIRGSEGSQVKSHATKRRANPVSDEASTARAPASSNEETTPSAPAAAAGEDPTPVVRAIRALRSDHNPAEAESLLQDYLRSHPHGALSEDALALLIETASAMRSPSATDRATRYLELYPNGRYRATARRVLASRP